MDECHVENQTNAQLEIEHGDQYVNSVLKTMQQTTLHTFKVMKLQWYKMADVHWQSLLHVPQGFFQLTLYNIKQNV